MALLERTSLQELDLMYEDARVDADTPCEKLRILFYLLIEHGRRHEWSWSSAQNDYKRLLLTQASTPGKTGSAHAFCKCLAFMAEARRAEFDVADGEDVVQISTFGAPDGAWMATPSTCGIDKHYRGNVVGPDGALTGFGVLPCHHVVLAFNRIFDVAMGWEHPYPGKSATDWQVQYRASRMHASFNTSLVHFAIWQATHIAAWDDEAPLMSVEWPPKDEHLLEKALPDGEGFLFERVDSDKGKMLLSLAYRFMKFHGSDVVRAFRLKRSGWFLWHAVDLDDVLQREKQEKIAAEKAAKRKAQLERLHGKKPKK